MASNSQTILVSKIPEDKKSHTELFLESPKKGGGEIKSFNYNKTTETATVIFEDEKVAKRFIEAGELDIDDGYKVSIQRYSPTIDSNEQFERTPSTSQKKDLNLKIDANFNEIKEQRLLNEPKCSTMKRTPPPTAKKPESTRRSFLESKSPELNNNAPPIRARGSVVSLKSECTDEYINKFATAAWAQPITDNRNWELGSIDKVAKNENQQSTVAEVMEQDCLSKQPVPLPRKQPSRTSVQEPLAGYDNQKSGKPLPKKKKVPTATLR